MKVSMSPTPGAPAPGSPDSAQARQVKQRLANPQESLSYELGKAVQELPPLYTRILAGGISAIVLGAIAWAHFSKIDEVAVANGKLIPSTEVRPIRATSVGSVNQIKVKAGDVVKKDQVLVEFDPGAGKTNVESLRKESEEIQQRITRLESESKGKVGGGSTEQSQLNTARLQDLNAKQASAIADANSKREAIDKSRTLLERYVENLRNAETSLRSTQESLVNRKDILAKAEDRRNRLSTLNRQGCPEDTVSSKPCEGSIVPHQEFIRAEQEVIQSRDGVTQAENTITEARDRIISLQKQIETQRQQITQDTQSYEASRNAAIGVLPERQGQVLAQLSQSREELAKKKGEIAVADKQKKERETIKAPFDGIVFNPKVTQGPVQQGEELLSLLPQNQDLVLEVKVTNRDIGFIRKTMRAKVKMATFPYQEFGIIDGDVIDVSPDAVVEKDENGQDMGPVFPVRVRLNQKTVVVRGKPVELTPGMVATAEIVTGKKSVLTFLMEPVTRRVNDAFSIR